MFRILKILLICGLMLGAMPRLFAEDHKKVMILTIPKSGSQLLSKAIYEIAKKPFFKPNPHYIIRDKIIEELTNNDSTTYFYSDHLVEDYDCFKTTTSNHLIFIIGIRDPRDVILSQIAWMDKTKMWWMTPMLIQEFNELPIEDRISRAMLLPDQNYGIQWFSRKALEWMKNPLVHICRFEDLVGPEGGGTREKQEKAIIDLAAHMGYEMTQERVAEIADGLFGGTFTFRNGQIGGWKEHFNMNHINLFREVLGDELIELGYEKNKDW